METETDGAADGSHVRTEKHADQKNNGTVREVSGQQRLQGCRLVAVQIR